MSFRELQRRCRELKLSPCGGKGVTKDSIEKLVAANEPKEEYEQLVYEQDPDLYIAIRFLVPDIPDIRPQATVRRMKKEKQDKWRLVYEELQALSRDDEEAREEQDLLAAINSGKRWRIEEFLRERELLDRFFERYPTLVWLLTQLTGEEVMMPLYIASGDLSLIKVVNDKVLRVVQDEVTAKKLVERFDWEDKEYTHGWESLGHILVAKAIHGKAGGASSLADEAIITGNLYILQSLEDKGLLEITQYFVSQLYIAARKGYADVISFLIERIAAIPLFKPGPPMEPYATQYKWNKIGKIFANAAEDGQISVINIIFDKDVLHNNPTVWFHAYRGAIKGGRTDIVRLLLTEYVELPEWRKIQRDAVIRGRPEILRLLLQDVRFDPTAKKNQLLDLAATYNRGDIIDILLEDERVRNSLTEKQQYNYL